MEFETGPFFFASTLATYGPGQPDPLPETAHQWPENIYGATKVAVERMGIYLKAKHDLDFRCLRFPFVLSPFAPDAALTAFASNAFKAAANQQEFVFPIAPDTGMSALFLDDVIRSIISIADVDAEKLKQPAYNLHGFTVTAGEIAEKLRNRYQWVKPKFDPKPEFETLLGSWPSAMVSDSAKRDWAWNAEFNFDKTADAMFDLFENP